MYGVYDADRLVNKILLDVTKYAGQKGYVNTELEKLRKYTWT